MLGKGWIMDGGRGGGFGMGVRGKYRGSDARVPGPSKIGKRRDPRERKEYLISLLKNI